MARRYAKPARKVEKDLPEDDSEARDEEEVDEKVEAPVPRARGFGFAASREPQSELLDFSAWPGTAEAAKIAQVHPSTIKNWRACGRLKASLDESGSWRHDPDSLAELVGTPETTDPATLLATGMTSIVQQGERAGDRLLAMTELTNASLERVLGLQGQELDRAYARIAVLEKERSELLDRSERALEANFKHERWLKRIGNEHELTMAEKKDGSGRLTGLLEILGPIAASIAARVVGDEATAKNAEAKAIGNGQSGQNGDTMETRITRMLGELDGAVRSLDDSEFKAFRCMLPDDVGRALDVVRSDADGAGRGAALAKICKTACSLSREQFDALAPIAPRPVAVVLMELRKLVNEEK